MYCPKCGTQNDDNAYKCTKCGIIIQQEPAVKKTSTAVIFVVVIAAVALFVAVVSIFAFGIPAFMDYTIKAKVSEVADAFDVLAEAAAEYHADNGQFPKQNYPLYNLVILPQTHGTFSCPLRASDNDITYRVTFNYIATHIDGCTLDIQITYAPATGYITEWLSTSTLPPKYMPQQ